MHTPDLVHGRPSVPRSLHALAESPIPMPRIWKITIRSAYNGKLAWTYAKIPYGGIYACTEQLTRALATGEILWFRIEPAKTITDHIRETLQRWPEALRSMTGRTHVTWLV